MNIGARFYVSKVAELALPSTPSRTTKNGPPLREVTLSSMYDFELDNSSASFARGNPVALITLLVSNPACAAEFKPGQIYLVDFTPKGVPA